MRGVAIIFSARIKPRVGHSRPGLETGTRVGSNGPLFTVIIPHLDQAVNSNLPDRSQAQRLDRSHLNSIIDNGSPSPPVDVVARYSGMRLLSELQPGPVQRATSVLRRHLVEFLAFIDADCQYHTGLALARYKLSHISGPDCPRGDVELEGK